MQECNLSVAFAYDHIYGKSQAHRIRREATFHVSGATNTKRAVFDPSFTPPTQVAARLRGVPHATPAGHSDMSALRRQSSETSDWRNPAVAQAPRPRSMVSELRVADPRCETQPVSSRRMAVDWPTAMVDDPRLDSLDPHYTANRLRLTILLLYWESHFVIGLTQKLF